MSPADRLRRAGPSGLELFEESVHLLRRAPAAAWVAYLSGAVPWVAGVAYFWARASWFAPGPAERAFAGLVLVGLFAGLKAGQAAFCAHLMALRLGAPPPVLGFHRLRGLAAAQLRLQVWGLFGLALAAALAVPFGWIYAFYQNASVLGAAEPGRPPLRREAWAQAELWPAQNHIGLLLIKVLAGTIWINLAASLYIVPWLANRLLGLENIFAVRGIAFLNSTFLALVTLLAWLAVDPLVKAFYTLRIFHGRARTTGDDLRTELAGTRAPGGRLAAIAALVAVALFLAARPSALAAPETAPPAVAVEKAPDAAGGVPAATPPPTAVAPLDLDRAIDRTLEDGDFQWSLRPLPRTEEDVPRNAFERFVDDCIKFLGETLRSIGRAIDNFFNWLGRLLNGQPRTATPGSAGPAAAGGAAKILLYVLCGIAALGLVWIAVLFWRQGRPGKAKPALSATAVAAAAPDLRDESVQAAQLPCDGWLELARQQMAAGEWRLALRALYLATLALRASEGLLVLARFKTNLDYERELARRALARRELVEHFRSRRRAFEDVWYGDSTASAEQVRAWLAEFDQPPPAATP